MVYLNKKHSTTQLLYSDNPLSIGESINELSLDITLPLEGMKNREGGLRLRGFLKHNHTLKNRYIHTINDAGTIEKKSITVLRLSQ